MKTVFRKKKASTLVFFFVTCFFFTFFLKTTSQNIKPDFLLDENIPHLGKQEEDLENKARDAVNLGEEKEQEEIFKQDELDENLGNILATEKSQEKLKSSLKKPPPAETNDDSSQTHTKSSSLSPLSTPSKSRNFWQGFWASISIIIVSEIGDKTFFIAAIMAMRHSRSIVLLGACSALILMTFLSSAMGFVFTLIPKIYTQYASILLFYIFGFKLLREGYLMDPNEGLEELEEVSIELKRKEEEYQNYARGGANVGEEGSFDVESKGRREEEEGLIGGESGEEGIERGKVVLENLRGFFEDYSQKISRFFNPVLLQAFTMTFLAEWGDRSQITTVVLCASENPYGVAIGGSIGHCSCTALAVVGGRILAQKISVRTVTMIGGLIFLMFAILSFYQLTSEE
eukprot:Sdes_comp19366_c0_seq1m10618